MSLNLDKSDEDLTKEYEEAVVSGKKNQRKIITIGLTIILVIFVSIPIIVAYFAYQSYISHVHVSNGSKAIGILDNEYTEVRSRTRPGPRYNIAYSFIVDGKTYTGTTSMPNKPVSKSVVVLYDPENPDNNKVEGGEDFFEEIVIGCLCVLVFSAGFGLFARAIKKGGSKKATT